MTTEDPQKKLIHYLRDELGLVGTKEGCGTGTCGSCTVLIDHIPHKACIVKLSQCENKKVETIESLGDENHLHPLQQAFIDEGAVQCGFCTPGMLLAAKALLDMNPHPSDDQIKYALRDNICRCTGYGAILRAVKKAAVMMNGNYPKGKEVTTSECLSLNASQKGAKEAVTSGYIGMNVPNKGAIAKVTGAKVFADDYYEERCLYGQILFSEHAHAVIKSIDVSKAEALDGVVKVATYKDIPGKNIFGVFVPQQPVLCQNKVKYFGDAVACVFAKTREMAKEALSYIRVDYEPLKALIDPEENMKEDSELIHENTDNNIVKHICIKKGDVNEGFEKADYIVENVYQTQSVEHAYLEPESCFAKPTASGVVVYSGSQGSHAYKRNIMTALGLEENQVQVVFTHTGGAFGGKEEPPVQILAALGAWLTKQPVKMALSREESIRMSSKRHPMKIWMKHGVTKNGEIVAVKAKAIGDAGAYIYQTIPVVVRAAVTASGPYDVKNIEAHSYGVYTHKNPSGAFRGFGSTQTSFAYESQMDQLAEAMNMSPYEFRLKNAYKKGVVTSTGQVLRDGIGFEGTLKAVNDSLEKMKKEYMDISREKHIKLGFGIASSYKNIGVGAGKPDRAGASVEVLESGRILVCMGAADLGQGVDTVSAQIAATALNVPYELIDVIGGDTSICPDGGLTTASKQTFLTGNAVKVASEMLLEKINGMAGEETLFTKDRLIDLFVKAKEQGQTLKVEHVYQAPKTYPINNNQDHKPGQDLDTNDTHYAYCFVSVAVAVEVNTETGEVNVLKVSSAQDVGKAINPKNIIGQIEGAIAMGIGYALREEFIVDDEKVHTNNFRKLNLLNSMEMLEVEPFVVAEEQIAGPYGAKGMGEVGLNAVAPAIANAIYDACEIRLKTLPMKPSRVLEALMNKELSTINLS